MGSDGAESGPTRYLEVFWVPPTLKKSADVETKPTGRYRSTPFVTVPRIPAWLHLGTDSWPSPWL